MSGAIIRRRLIFSGSVQGVGFRWRARKAAEAFGATGWVRNESDGRVSMELQGTRAQLELVLAALERGLYVRIEDVESEILPVKPDERGFLTLDDRW